MQRLCTVIAPHLFDSADAGAPLWTQPMVLYSATVRPHDALLAPPVSLECEGVHGAWMTLRGSAKFGWLPAFAPTSGWYKGASMTRSDGADYSMLAINVKRGDPVRPCKAGSDRSRDAAPAGGNDSGKSTLYNIVAFVNVPVPAAPPAVAPAVAGAAATEPVLFALVRVYLDGAALSEQSAQEQAHIVYCRRRLGLEYRFVPADAIYTRPNWLPYLDQPLGLFHPDRSHVFSDAESDAWMQRATSCDSSSRDIWFCAGMRL